MNFKKSIIISGLLLFILNGCDNKNEISEELVASDNKQITNNFESKKFNLKTIDGEKLELETTLSGIKINGLEDKIVLIDVFATWCPPCIKGIPAMNKLQEEYKDDLVIVSVLFEKDKDKEELKQFIKEHNINYIMTVSEENFNLSEELGNITQVPEYYLYDKNGVYIKKFIGETSTETFKAYIENII